MNQYLGLNGCCDSEKTSLGEARVKGVLMWTDSDAFAGTEQHIGDLETGLRKAGLNVRIACPHPSPLSDHAAETGGLIVPLSRNLIGYICSVWTIRGLLRSGCIDVIHAHNGRSAFFAALACRLAGTGILIVTQHFIRPARIQRRGVSRWLSNTINHWVSSRVDQWIAVSEAVRVALLGRGEGMGTGVTVIYNGSNAVRKLDGGESVCVRFHKPLQLATPRVICVARLVSEKGHQTLLHALAILVAEKCNFLATFVGDGLLKDALLSSTVSLGLEGVVEFVGYQRNVGEWINSSDILVLASPEEPFGLVLLEAMLRRKPVVAARAGGPCEIVEDGRSGLLFTPGDPRDLALKLRSLLEHPKLRGLMGEAGFVRWNTSFNTEVMCHKTIEVYRTAKRINGLQREQVFSHQAQIF